MGHFRWIQKMPWIQTSYPLGPHATDGSRCHPRWHIACHRGSHSSIHRDKIMFRETIPYNLQAGGKLWVDSSQKSHLWKHPEAQSKMFTSRVQVNQLDDCPKVTTGFSETYLLWLNLHVLTSHNSSCVAQIPSKLIFFFHGDKLDRWMNIFADCDQTWEPCERYKFG